MSEEPRDELQDPLGAIEHARFVDNLPVAIFVVDAGGRPCYANPAARELLGQGIVHDAVGERLGEVYGAYVAGTDEPYPVDRMPILRALNGENCTVDDMEVRTPEGTRWLQVWASPVLSAESGVDFAIAAFLDITERKKAEVELAKSKLRAEEVSLRDDLTGLSNRRGLSLASETLLKVADRSNRSLTLLYIDLNNMKSINDKLGHFHGDAALVETAGLLKQSFRDSDVLARVGGDEFCVLLTTGSEDFDYVPVERLKAALRARNADPEQAYELTVSIGVAHLSPHGNKSLEELMAEADAAMYEEKARQRARRKILVVDDSETALFLTQTLFGDDHEVATARSGAQALEMAERVVPDLILLDMELPDIDGSEVALRLRESIRTRSIPIMMVTAAAIERQSFREGFDDFVQKPYDNEIFQSRVNNLLRRLSAR